MLVRATTTTRKDLMKEISLKVSGIICMNRWQLLVEKSRFFTNAKVMVINVPLLT